jgi:hypothetical protein
MRQIGTKIKADNLELKLLIDVANELFDEGKVSSFRDFSRKYLSKTSNYMNILFYDNTKKTSIKALLGLHHKLVNEGNETFVGKIKKLVFNKLKNQYLPQ